MKVLVTYFSMSGQTKKVADAIFNAIGCDKDLAEMGEVSSLDGYDVTFVGFPVIAFGAAPQAKEFLEKNASGRKVALFITHAGDSDSEECQGWLSTCREAAASADLIGTFNCRGELSEQIAEMLLKSDDPKLQGFGAHRGETIGQPDEESLEKAEEFARALIEEQAG